MGTSVLESFPESNLGRLLWMLCTRNFPCQIIERVLRGLYCHKLHRKDAHDIFWRGLAPNTPEFPHQFSQTFFLYFLAKNFLNPASKVMEGRSTAITVRKSANSFMPYFSDDSSSAFSWQLCVPFSQPVLGRFSW